MKYSPGKKEKWIIGLTGNIGGGKSLVRRMLENCGALGIDADALAHRTLMPHSTGYAATIRRFGEEIIDSRNGAINRQALGRIVFADPSALKDLEDITHPLVDQAVTWLVEKAIQPVIIIEAIKLLESSLVKKCDSIWVVDAPEKIRLARLIEQRGMQPDDAARRIKAQSDQNFKINAANVVIKNDKGQEETWRQVQQYWEETLPDSIQESAKKVWPDTKKEGYFSFSPAIRDDVVYISQILAKEGSGEVPDIRNRLWDQKFLFKKAKSEISILLEYVVDNLACVLCRLDDFRFGKTGTEEYTGWAPVLEAYAKFNLCEIVIIPKSSLKNIGDGTLERAGYKKCKPSQLAKMTWQESVANKILNEKDLWYKILNSDYIL